MDELELRQESTGWDGTSFWTKKQGSAQRMMGKYIRTQNQVERALTGQTGTFYASKLIIVIDYNALDKIGSSEFI